MTLSLASLFLILSLLFCPEISKTMTSGLKKSEQAVDSSLSLSDFLCEGPGLHNSVKKSVLAGSGPSGDLLAGLCLVPVFGDVFILVLDGVVCPEISIVKDLSSDRSTSGVIFVGLCDIIGLLSGVFDFWDFALLSGLLCLSRGAKFDL